MARTVGDLIVECAGLGETVPVLVNGEEITEVIRMRNDAGDLALNLLTGEPDTEEADSSAEEKAEQVDPVEVADQGATFEPDQDQDEDSDPADAQPL